MWQLPTQKKKQYGGGVGAGVAGQCTGGSPHQPNLEQHLPSEQMPSPILPPPHVPETGSGSPFQTHILLVPTFFPQQLQFLVGPCLS
mmetsp:Transcript_1666/g.2670  ORF Transcript_1666/g.2670 Transcript_1666/m.2670 type:complete len:87 (+) Transcript_1666:98-358(+)